MSVMTVPKPKLNETTRKVNSKMPSGRAISR